MSESTSHSNATFQTLLDTFADANVHASKFFDKSNNTAGTRLRKSLLALKSLSHDLRKEIQVIISERKVSRLSAKGDKADVVVDGEKKSKKKSKKKPVVEVVEEVEVVGVVEVVEDVVVEAPKKRRKKKKNKAAAASS
jgi:hypothetical protein